MADDPAPSRGGTCTFRALNIIKCGSEKNKKLILAKRVKLFMKKSRLKVRKANKALQVPLNK